MTWVLLLAGSYLLGSISWSYLIVHASSGIDVRTVGSGNAGATNVLRASGLLPALAALALDVGKGAAAVVAARLLEAPGPVVGGAALAVVLGHVFPAYHGLRGGKGVATASGAFAGLAPLPAALAILAFLLITVTTRFVSLGSITGLSLFPALLYLCGRIGWTPEPPTWLLASAVAITVLIVYKHHDNIRRLRHGTESKLGAPRGRKEAA